MTVDDLLISKSNISKQLPNCKIVLSKKIIQNDDGKSKPNDTETDKHLSALQSECVESNNISSQHHKVLSKSENLLCKQINEENTYGIRELKHPRSA